MVLVLALVLTLAQSNAGSTAEVTRELTRLEQQLAASWQAGDCVAWSAMLAPEWSVIHITGAVVTRAEALEMCRAPAVPIVAFEIDDISVRVFGDAAVVTGRSRVATGGASPGQITLRFTDVFIRRDGRWRVVASHATRMGS